MATSENAHARLACRIIEDLQHPLLLHPILDWPIVDALFQAIADLNLAGNRHQLRQQRLVDIVMQIQSLDRLAYLP